MKRQLEKVIIKLNLDPNKIAKSDLHKIFSELEVEWDRDDLFGYLPAEVKQELKTAIDQSDMIIDLLRRDNRTTTLSIVLPVKKMKRPLHLSYFPKEIHFLYNEKGLILMYDLKSYEKIKKKSKVHHPRFFDL